FRVQRDGLLYEDMLAGFERGQRRRGVLLRGIADVDHVDVWIGQQLVELLVLLDSGQVHLRAGRPEVAADAAPVAGAFLGIAAADGGDLGTFQFLRGQVMNHAHETNAYDSDPYHCCNSCFCSRLWISMFSMLPTVLACFF